ncbi:MAG: TonB-dependent receptor plug domain-containing protein, partial [Syntrophothermus sp.]
SRNHKISLLDIYAYDHEEFGRDDAIEQGSSHYGLIDNFQNTAGISWKALWTREFYSSTSISLAVQNFKNNFNKVSDSEKYYISDNTEASLSFRNINILSLNSGSRLEFGFDANVNNGKYNYIKYPDISRLGTALPGFSVNRSTGPVRSGLYFVFIYSPSEQIKLSAGVRGDHYQSGNENVISPRASLSWAVTNLLTLSFNGGIFYQQNPLVIISQRPEFAGLKTLKARHLGADIEYLLAEDTKASLEIYDKQYSRLPLSPDDPSLCVIDEGISGSSFGNFNLLESRGKAGTRGVELLIQKKMSDDFYGMISGSYFRSRYMDFNGIWHDRQWDNKYMFNFTGGYKPSKEWEFSLRWTYAGGCPYTPFDQALSAAIGTGIIDNSRINAERYPVYHSLNLRADKKFFFSSQSLDVYLSVWNAYNRKNISGYYWNPEKNRAVEMNQWTIMPIFGIEYEM